VPTVILITVTTGECHWVFGTSTCTKIPYVTHWCYDQWMLRLCIVYIISQTFFSMQLITNERGQIVCSDMYLHELPQVMTGILLDCIAKKGLRPIFAGCLDGAIQPGVLDCDEEDNNNRL
jgi:hypothetical protein